MISHASYREPLSFGSGLKLSISAFFLALAVVTTASFVFEKLGEMVEGHKPDPSLRNVLGTIITLATFELLVTAIHTSVDVGPWARLEFMAADPN